MMLNAKFCLSFEKICFIINNIAATSKIIISIHHKLVIFVKTLKD